MLSMNRYRLVLAALALTTLAFIIACGTSETATVTPPPATTPGAAATDATIAPVATLVPTLIPAATDAPAMTGPQGTLKVAITDLGPANYMLRNQGQRLSRYNVVVNYETMFAMHPDGRIVPRLVKDWSVDPSGLIYTFELQEGAKWHQKYGDWGEFNADDFLFSVEDVTTEASPHPALGGINKVFKCEGCELTKTGEYTVQLTRPEPTALITWYSRAPVSTSMSFHSKRHFDAVGEDLALHDQSVGTGPWELVEQKVSDRKITRAVQDHWRKTPEFEEMVWIEISEAATKIANFLAGTVDTGEFSLEDLQAIRAARDPEHKFMTFSGAGQRAIQLLGQQYYTDHPAHHPTADGKEALIPLGDNAYDCSFAWVACDRDTSSEEWAKARKVRLAMSMALDREKLVRNLSFGEGEPIHIFDWVTYDTRLEQFGLDQLSVPYDLDGARELLAEAGFPDGFEMEATLATSGDLVTQAAATMWEDIGIRTTLITLPYSSLRPTLVRRTAKGAWGQGGGPTSIEPLERYGILQNAANPINFGYEHPEWQAMLDEAFTLVDTEERWAKMAEMAQWQFDNVILIPAFSLNLVWPLGPNVDVWEPLAGDKGLLSNWEFAPHRK